MLGFINKYQCSLCGIELADLSSWLRHITSSRSHVAKVLQKPLSLPGQFSAAPTRAMVVELFDEKNQVQ